MVKEISIINNFHGLVQENLSETLHTVYPPTHIITINNIVTY
jgi:hypothetical protein